MGDGGLGEAFGDGWSRLTLWIEAAVSDYRTFLIVAGIGVGLWLVAKFNRR